MPIGFLTAVFLAKVAPPKVAAVIRPAVELLAGIPSVVYGLVGMMVLVPWIRTTFDLPAGDSLFAAIIVLAVMILPSIISVSETALQAVPKEYEEASLALGATELETYFRVTVPAAKSGIAAAVVLGIGRAIGEAMAIIMVAGNVANMPSLFSSVRFLTTGIAVEMNYASPGSLQRNALYSIGLVLFLFIMLINVVLNVVLKRDKEVKDDETMTTTSVTQTAGKAKSKLSPRRRAYEITMRTLLYVSAGLTCLLLLFLIGYICVEGMPRHVLAVSYHRGERPQGDRRYPPRHSEYRLCDGGDPDLRAAPGCGRRHLPDGVCHQPQTGGCH